MPCEHCSEAMVSGDKFCRFCGDQSQAVTIDSLNMRVADLQKQIGMLDEARLGKEQKYLDVETTEMVVERLKKWSTYFAWFAGVPVALILITLGVFAGKTYNSFSEVVRDGKRQVSALLERAKQESGLAADQAKGALKTSQDVNKQVAATTLNLRGLNAAVHDNTERVNQLGSDIDHEQAKVRSLNDQIDIQTRAISGISQSVQNLGQGHLVQEINDRHPEFGAHTPVSASTGEKVLSANKKPTDVYTTIDIVNANQLKPNYKADDIATKISALNAHGFQTFFGGVILEIGSGRSYTSTASIGGNICQLARLPGALSPTQGAPCIIYFRSDMRSKAIEAQRLLNPLEHIADDRITLIPESSTDTSLKELIDKSGVDLAIVLGP